MNQHQQEILERELHCRELLRRDALVSQDATLFASLLADDLVHVHATGNVHGKQQVIEHAIGFLEFIDIKRGPLTIRSLALDVAVMTGAMKNIVRRKGHDERIDVDAFVTQVWVKRDNEWMIASFHAVRLPDDKSSH